VELYAPHDVPDEQASAAYLRAKAPEPLTPHAAGHAAGVSRLGGLALVEAIRRIDRAAHAWPVSRARLQPLAYFTTTAGIPTGWAFTLRADGPACREVPATVARLLRAGLLVERQTGAMRTLHLGPSLYEGVGADPALARYGSSIDRVADLMTRLDNDTSRLVATTHHAVTVLADQLGRPPSEREAIAALRHRDRNRDRNRPPGPLELPEEGIATAIHELTSLGWLQVRPEEDSRVQQPNASISQASWT
jgi:hypothetical protein